MYEVEKSMGQLDQKVAIINGAGSDFGKGAANFLAGMEFVADGGRPV